MFEYIVAIGRPWGREIMPWPPGIHGGTVSVLPSPEWGIQSVLHKCWQWLGSCPWGPSTFATVLGEDGHWVFCPQLLTNIRILGWG